MDGELPRREDLGIVFDELDHQMACQVYCGRCRWCPTRNGGPSTTSVFGATGSDLVHYVSYRDRLGLITANATTPYILNFFDLGRDRSAGRSSCRPVRPPAACRTSGSASSACMGEMGPDAGPRRPAPRRPARQDGAGRRTDGYVVQRSTGMNMMFGFRTLDPDPRAGAGAGRGRADLSLRATATTRRRPGSSPRRPAWSGDQPRGLDYWGRLHDIYQREIVDERDRFYLAMLKQLGHREGQAVRARRAADRDPQPRSRRRRADGAGQHIRQAVRGLAVLAGPPMGPRDRARQLRPARPRTTTNCWSARRGSTRRSASPRR